MDPSQRDLICDEEMDEAEDFHIHPEDQESSLKRSHAFVGRKAPRSEWNQYAPQGISSEEDDEVAEQPDLAEYFSQWKIPEKDIILMCRSYASYISHKAKAQQK